MAELPTRLDVRKSIKIVSRAEIPCGLRGLQVRISVVLVTRNNPNGALLAVQSVRDQNFQDWELLVVDNGNGDGVEAILKFADIRIKAFLNPEHGLLKARNAGLVMALSENVVYLNDHEIWDESHLERCFDARRFMPSWLISSLSLGSQVGN